ncbi:MAG: TetR/AcrR family transcriptional regulator [Sphingomonadales bacterium]
MSRTLSQQDLSRFQAELCDVAEVMFAENGAENVSMRQIAAAMGISPMTPYRYFANRDEILAAVRIRGFDRFTRELQQAHAAANGSVQEQAMAAGRAYIAFGLRNANTYTLMFAHRQRDDESDSPLGQAVARARKTLSFYGDSLIQRGMPMADARAMEALIWSTLHGAVMHELTGVLPAGSALETLQMLGRMTLAAPSRSL